MGGIIQRAWADDFSPRDRRPIYAWAADKIILRPPFRQTGRFDVSSSRQFIGPFDALLDPIVREVNICAPVRDGKTLIADVWLPWTICNFPGSFLGVFQKDDVAKEHCETRTWRILESIPEIVSMLDSMSVHAARTQEIMFEDPIYIWGPSIKNLQGKGFQYLWMDEVWQLEKGIIREAKARLGDALKMGLDKTLITSQGGHKQDQSAFLTADWWEQFNAGELNVWHVECSACGKFHVPALGQLAPDRVNRVGLVWDEHRNERGQWKISKAVESARYVCPHCAAVFPLIDQAKVRDRWNKTGKHVKVGEEKRVKKSFTNNGIISWPWEFLVEEFLTSRNAAAMGDRAHTIQFFQKYMAQFHDQHETGDYDQLESISIENDPAACDVTEIEHPPQSGEKILFPDRQMMIDVQMRELYVLVDAWNHQGDDVTLHCERVDTFDEAAAIQARFNIPPQDVGIDINYDLRKTEVALECCRRGELTKGPDGKVVWNQWIAYRGSDKPHFPHKRKTGPDRQYPFSQVSQDIPPCPTRNLADWPKDLILPNGRAKMCRVFSWSNPTIKDVLEQRRDGRAKAIRSLIIEAEWNDIYSRHMGAERKVQRQDRKGHVVWEYVKTRDDHLRDCKAMSIAHAMRRGRLNLGGVD